MDWDLTELGQQDNAPIAALVGSSSLGWQKNGSNFSIDLKLGRLGDIGDESVDKIKDLRGSTVVPSPSGSSKRTRALNRTQNVTCLVDGCTSDLSNCREYHRRHRVCERHSKTPIVLVGGEEQRFCQQCSRFHSLGEFDNMKRSCRKRLHGHNRRRRKPQLEPLYMSSGSFMSNYQGRRMLQFSGPQAYTTTAAGGSSFGPSIAKHRQQLHVIDQQSTFPNSFACIYNGDKRFPFLLADDPNGGNQAAPVVPICQRHFNTNAPPERGGGHQKILSNGLKPSIDSMRALSLLSTHPSQTSRTSLSHLVQRDVIHLSQPTDTSLNFNGIIQYSCSQAMEDKPIGPVLVPDASNSDNQCCGIFHMGPDGLLENEASQVLPFSWK